MFGIAPSQTTTGNKLHITTFGYLLDQRDEDFAVGTFDPKSFIANIAKELVNKPFDHNETRQIETSSSDRWTDYIRIFYLIHAATQLQDNELLASLIAKNADVNSIATTRKIHDVRYINQYSQRTMPEENDSRIDDSEYFTALNIAIALQNQPIITLLKQHGAKTYQELTAFAAPAPTHGS